MTPPKPNTLRRLLPWAGLGAGLLVTVVAWSSFAHGPLEQAGILLGGLLLGLGLFLLARARRHAAEQAAAIQAMEARFSALFEKAPLGMAIRDTDSGTYLAVNPALAAMLGHRPEDLVGRRILGGVPPDAPSSNGADRARRLQERKPGLPEEKVFRHRDGHPVVARVHAAPLPSCPGEEPRHVAIVEDVTERVAAERALVASEARFRLLAEGTQDFVYQLRLRPVLAFAYVSPACERLNGYTPEEHYQDPDLAMRVVHPEDRGLIDEILAKLDMLQEPLPPFTLRWIRKDGRVAWVEETLSLLRDGTGKVYGVQGSVRDVTQRVELQEALQAGAERLRILADQLPDSFVYQIGQDPEGRTRFHYVSAGVERLCGVKVEDLLRNPALLLERIDPEQLPSYQAAEEASAQEGSPFAMDLRQRGPDGSWRWFRVRSAPRLFPDGSRVWEGISTDVTEQVMAVRALVDSEAKFRMISENSGDVIWLLDLALGRFVYVSPAVERLRGMSPEEVMAEAPEAALTPESAARVKARMAARIAAYRPEDPATGTFTDQVDQVRKDGSVVPTEVVTRFLPGPGGHPGHVLGITRDITERLQAEEALRESEARFRVVAEESPVALFLHAEGRFVYLNPAALRLLGAEDPTLLLGQPVIERVHPADRERVLARIRRASEAGEEAPRIEERLLRLDGSAVEVEVAGRPVLFQGRPAMLLFAQDIRNRKQVQAQELRARKAESLILMAGGIAHDFNNLFQALMSSLDLAALRSRENPAVQAPLRTAREVLRNAVELSWKMLDFSGRSFLQAGPLDLPALLETRKAILSKRLPASIKLQMEFPPGLPRILADPDKLVGVIQAVVENAAEAMPDGGKVRVRACVDDGKDPQGPAAPGIWPIERPGVPETVCVEFADEGPGVAPEELGRIFDPFYTTRAPGRGLGLPSVLGVLRGHGAGLHVFNDPEGGLVLRLHFLPAGN